MDHNERYREGHAEKAADAELKRKGLFKQRTGPYQMTTASGKDVFNPSDGSTIITAGPRSKKTSGFFMRAIPQALRELKMNCFVHDPRGEIAAMLALYCSIERFALYTVNFGQFSWAPHYRTNVWDHLVPESNTLTEDSMEAMLDAIPQTTDKDGKSKWWEDDARAFGCQIIIWLVLRDGSVSPKTFFQFVALILGDENRGWTEEQQRMAHCEHALVRQFAGQVLCLKENGKDSFTAPFSTLSATFAFCKSPHYADAVSISDFSLEDLAHPDKKMVVMSMPPFQHLQLLSAPQRMVISRIIRAKLQRPGGRRVAFFLDEAGQLGVGFKRLPELFTFLGGAGCYTVASYQDYFQMVRCAGSRPAGDELFGSAQFRQFRSVRSIESAKIASEMAGDQTLEFNQDVDQSRAMAERRKVAKAVMSGGSLADASAELQHQSFASTYREKKRRRLITPSEVLTSEDVIAFATSLSGPLFGGWVSVYDDRKLDGLILNNPYHGEAVRMRRGWWPFKEGPERLRYKHVPIREQAVPKAWAKLPQYQQGHLLRYPKGFKPRIRRIAEIDEFSPREAKPGSEERSVPQSAVQKRDDTLLPAAEYAPEIEALRALWGLPHGFDLDELVQRGEELCKTVEEALLPRINAEFERLLPQCQAIEFPSKEGIPGRKDD